MFDPKESWSIYTVVAQLVRLVAQLTAATAVAHGKLPGREDALETLLDDVLGQLDTLLVLGTHFSVLAAKAETSSGAVQRLRRKLVPGNETSISLEEVREFVAQSILQMRRTQQETEWGPDTDRHDSLAEGSK